MSTRHDRLAGALSRAAEALREAADLADQLPGATWHQSAGQLRLAANQYDDAACAVAAAGDGGGEA